MQLTVAVKEQVNPVSPLVIGSAYLIVPKTRYETELRTNSGIPLYTT